MSIIMNRNNNIMSVAHTYEWVTTHQQQQDSSSSDCCRIEKKENERGKYQQHQIQVVSKNRSRLRYILLQRMYCCCLEWRQLWIDFELDDSIIHYIMMIVLFVEHRLPFLLNLQAWSLQYFYYTTHSVFYFPVVLVTRGKKNAHLWQAS